MAQTYSHDQITNFVRNQRNLREETTEAGEQRFFFTDSSQQEPALAFTPTSDGHYTLTSLDPSLKAVWQQSQTQR